MANVGSKKGKMGRLSSEQQELVASNTLLAKWFSSRNSSPRGMSQDEWEAECLYRLCHAAIYFNVDGKAKFSTYAFMSFRSGFSAAMAYRVCRVRDARRNAYLSDDHDWIDNSGMYPGREMEQREARDQVLMLIDSLTGIQKEVVEDRLKGKGFSDISRERGVSRQACKEIHRRAVQRMAREAARIKLEPAI